MNPARTDRATAASVRRYAIVFTLVILLRCCVMFSNPRPIKAVWLVAYSVLVLGILVAIWLGNLRPIYGFIVIATIIFELAYRHTLFKPLLFVVGALAILFGVLVVRDNPKPS